MTTPRLALALALLGAASLAPSVAQAASVAPRNKLRVHLDTEALAWIHSRPPRGFADLGAAPSNTFGLGFGRPVTGDSTLGGPVIALGIGYGVHRHLVFGARFGLNYSNTPRTGVDSRIESFTGTFTPYLEILPLAQGRVLPFILFRTGISGGLSNFEANQEFQVNRAFAPLVGTGFGAHAFIGRYFSIDFGLTFDYRWRYSLSASGPVGGPPIPARWTFSSHGFTLAASLGISTWF